eukprot:3562628-Prymnesium_polylepis.2
MALHNQRTPGARRGSRAAAGARARCGATPSPRRRCEVADTLPTVPCRESGVGRVFCRCFFRYTHGSRVDAWPLGLALVIAKTEV